MGDSDDCQTKSFGPDGSITDPVILRLIKESKPLPPKDLLKLATFFAKIPTYAVLTERLVVSALFTILTTPKIAKDVQALFSLNTVEQADIDEDNRFWDLIQRGGVDDKDQEDPKDGTFLLTSLIGVEVKLLVEVQGKHFFAVAVSPDPETLPDDPEAQSERVKSLGRHIARRATRKS